MLTEKPFRSKHLQELVKLPLSEAEKTPLEAQGHYAQVYEAISALAKQRGRDYLNEVAQKAGIPAAVMTDYFNHYLNQSVAAPVHLQKEACSFCQQPLVTFERETAACLQCLQRLAQALPEFSEQDSLTTLEAPQAAISSTPTAGFAIGMVPMDMFLALQKELIRYQLKFGVLPDSEDLTANLTETKPLESPTQPGTVSEIAQDSEAITQSLNSQKPSSEADATNLLGILNLDDQTVKQSMNELNAFMQEMDLEKQGQEPLRYFGFLRPKSYHSH